MIMHEPKVRASAITKPSQGWYLCENFLTQYNHLDAADIIELEDTIT